MSKKLHDILVHLILGLIFLFIGNYMFANPPKGLINEISQLKFLYIGIIAILISIGIFLTLSSIFIMLESSFKKSKVKRTKIKFK